MLGNLFKKKPTFTPAMQELFVKISLALPQRFHFLQKQLTEGIIKGIKKPEGQRYQLRLDIPLLNKYEDKKGRNFLIENIVIQSVETGKSSVVSWNVAYGLLLVYITANTSPQQMARYIADFALNGGEVFNGKVLQVANTTP